MNKVELVEKMFKGYVEMAEDKNKIEISLNIFDEEVKDYLEDLYADDEDYYYGDDEQFLTLTSELNSLLVDKFEEAGYTIYKNGESFVDNGIYTDVMPDIVVAIK